MADKDSLELGEVTRLLRAWQAGDTQAFPRLFELVYGELRRRAHGQLVGEFHGSGMQTTALVGELFELMKAKQDLTVADRKHFYNLASQAMCRFLVDQARIRQSVRRGGHYVHTVYDDASEVRPAVQAEIVLALHQALNDLKVEDEELYLIVLHRFFMGYSIAETADILDCSTTHINRRWAFAKVWLQSKLQERKDEPPEEPDPAP